MKHLSRRSCSRVEQAVGDFPVTVRDGGDGMVWSGRFSDPGLGDQREGTNRNDIFHVAWICGDNRRKGEGRKEIIRSEEEARRRQERGRMWEASKKPCTCPP